MTTLAEFVEGIKPEVINQNERTDQALRLSTVRALDTLKTKVATFTEASTVFTSVINQQSYTPAEVGAPDLWRVVNAYWLAPSAATRQWRQEMVQVPISTIKRDDWYSNEGTRRYSWAWFENKFWIGPNPTTTQGYELDYIRDAAKDSAGTKISPNNDDWTNVWLDDAEGLVRAAVLNDYFLSFARDGEMAQYYAVIMNSESDALRKDYERNQQSFVVGTHLPYYGGGV